MKYEQPDAGGSWDHRSGDCPKHGDNIPFTKPHKASEPYLCVACKLQTDAKRSRFERRVNVYVRAIVAKEHAGVLYAEADAVPPTR